MLCIWLLSFYDGAVEAFSTGRVLPRIVEVVKISTKEKVLMNSSTWALRLEGEFTGFSGVDAMIKLLLRILVH